MYIYTHASTKSHDGHKKYREFWLSNNFCGHRGSQSLAQRYSEKDKFLQFDNQRIMLCEPLDYLCETLCQNFTPQKIVRESDFLIKPLKIRQVALLFATIYKGYRDQNPPHCPIVMSHKILTEPF